MYQCYQAALKQQYAVFYLKMKFQNNFLQFTDLKRGGLTQCPACLVCINLHRSTDIWNLSVSKICEMMNIQRTLYIKSYRDKCLHDKLIHSILVLIYHPNCVPRGTDAAKERERRLKWTLGDKRNAWSKSSYLQPTPLFFALSAASARGRAASNFHDVGYCFVCAGTLQILQPLPLYQTDTQKATMHSIWQYSMTK